MNRRIKTKQDVYVLGISESHNASAVLLKNGRVIGAYNEERFNRKKNYVGYPKKAIHTLFAENGLRGRDLSYVVLSFQRATLFAEGEVTLGLIGSVYRVLLFLTYHFKILNDVYHMFYELLYLGRLNKKLYLENVARIAKDLKVDSDRIISYPHHLNHAASVVYGLSGGDKRMLVMTNDGAGDRYCASVIVYSDHQFNEVAKIHNKHSLASLYAQATIYMGMRANEHEYKIMGLAPYVNPSQHGVSTIYESLSSIHTVRNLSFRSRIDERHFQYYLEKQAKRIRFDALSYALQEVVEEKLEQWVQNAVKETMIGEVYCAGGVFMNVKANKRLAELESVKKLCVMPSASDESTAIGAAYLGYIKHCRENNKIISTKPLDDLYLGNAYSNKEVGEYIKKRKLDKKYKVRRVKDPEAIVARLVSKGNIVARFSGRMEFGQRALGSRSILADPSNTTVVRTLNDQIKSRDFWMPFCVSILDTSEDKYVVNPKRLKAYYMILSFDTKPEHREDIIAGIHPYDYTARPQIVTKKMNEKYYRLIEQFEKITGIGAVLNTSFNIHGEPIVCTLRDAFRTFESSGLRYLQVENWIIEKLK